MFCIGFRNHLPSRWMFPQTDATYKMLGNVQCRNWNGLDKQRIPRTNSPVRWNTLIVVKRYWTFMKNSSRGERMLIHHVTRQLSMMVNSLPPGQNGRHFGRRHFQMHYLEKKCLNCDSNFAETSSQESNWQLTFICSGNGLAPNRWQAITWNNDNPVHLPIYAALRGAELREVSITMKYVLVYPMGTAKAITYKMLKYIYY